MKTIRNTKLFNELVDKPEAITLYDIIGSRWVKKDCGIPILLGGLDHIEITRHGIYFFDRGRNNKYNDFVIRAEL